LGTIRGRTDTLIRKRRLKNMIRMENLYHFGNRNPQHQKNYGCNRNINTN